MEICCILRDGSRMTAQIVPNESNAIGWADNVIYAITGESLMSRLNDIQLGCRSENGETLFPDKFTMPLCIVNLVLKEFNLEIKEEKQ